MNRSKQRKQSSSFPSPLPPLPPVKTPNHCMNLRHEKRRKYRSLGAAMSLSRFSWRTLFPFTPLPPVQKPKPLFVHFCASLWPVPIPITKIKTDRIMTRQNHKRRFPMILSRHDSVAESASAYSAVLFFPIANRKSKIENDRLNPRHSRSPHPAHCLAHS